MFAVYDIGSLPGLTFSDLTQIKLGWLYLVSRQRTTQNNPICNFILPHQPWQEPLLGRHGSVAWNMLSERLPRRIDPSTHERPQHNTPQRKKNTGRRWIWRLLKMHQSAGQKKQSAHTAYEHVYVYDGLGHMVTPQNHPMTREKSDGHTKEPTP